MITLFMALQAATIAWEYKDLVDPITDFKRGIASVTDNKQMLIVKCDPGKSHEIYATIVVDKWLGKGPRPFRAMQYRFDSGEPQTMTAYHADKSVVIMNGPYGKARDQFVPRILSASKLAVKLTTYDGEIYTTVLNIAGGRQAVESAIATCGDTTVPLN